MTRNRLFTIAIVAILGIFTGSLVFAQDNAPITWRCNVKMTSKTEGEIILKATISEGWHLYGTTLPKGGPKPTSIKFDKSTGVKFIGNPAPSKKPVEMKDPMFGITLNYWSGIVIFRQKFKVTDKAKAHIGGEVIYMGCNDQTCTPPATFNISKKIK